MVPAAPPAGAPAAMLTAEALTQVEQQQQQLGPRVLAAATAGAAHNADFQPLTSDDEDESEDEAVPVAAPAPAPLPAAVAAEEGAAAFFTALSDDD